MRRIRRLWRAHRRWAGPGAQLLGMAMAMIGVPLVWGLGAPLPWIILLFGTALFSALLGMFLDDMYAS